MKDLVGNIRDESVRGEVARGLHRFVLLNYKTQDQLGTWSSFATFLSRLLIQHRDDKRGFKPLNPEKIKGVWPKGYVIKRKDVK